MPCNMSKRDDEVDMMKYIAKGMVVKASTTDLLYVMHGGFEFQLTGIRADLWLNSRFGFSQLKENVLTQQALQQLKRQELVEVAKGDGALGEYRALTQCIPVPAAAKGILPRLNSDEKEMLHWLTDAGLRLTVAELVCLKEHSIQPTPTLFGIENRQALTETIYTQNNIFDNLLEAQMEHAQTRDAVTRVLLSLLKKKRVILL